MTLRALLITSSYIGERHLSNCTQMEGPLFNSADQVICAQAVPLVNVYCIIQTCRKLYVSVSYTQYHRNKFQSFPYPIPDQRVSKAKTLRFIAQTKYNVYRTEYRRSVRKETFAIIRYWKILHRWLGRTDSHIKMPQQLSHKKYWRRENKNRLASRHWYFWVQKWNCVMFGTCGFFSISKPVHYKLMSQCCKYTRIFFYSLYG